MTRPWVWRNWMQSAQLWACAHGDKMALYNEPNNRMRRKWLITMKEPMIKSIEQCTADIKWSWFIPRATFFIHTWLDVWHPGCTSPRCLYREAIHLQCLSLTPCTTSSFIITMGNKDTPLLRNSISFSLESDVYFCRLSTKVWCCPRIRGLQVIATSILCLSISLAMSATSVQTRLWSPYPSLLHVGDQVHVCLVLYTFTCNICTYVYALLSQGRSRLEVINSH